MLNAAKCQLTRELGRSNDKILEVFAEDTLTKSALVSKPLRLPPTTKTTFFLAISPDGKYVASAHGDHSVYVCETGKGRVIHRLTGHPRSPWTITFHPVRNDLLASGCLGGEVRVWDLKTGCSETLRINGEEGDAGGSSCIAVASLAFHPEERLLAIAAGNRLLFWDWSTKYPHYECRTSTPRERVRYVKFDWRGLLYTGITNTRSPTPSTPSTSLTESTFYSAAPVGCRQLLTSRNKILQTRAELARRHQQLLQRYNDLLRRYEELRDRYPLPDGLTDEDPNGFVSLMEENRQAAASDLTYNDICGLYRAMAQSTELLISQLQSEVSGSIGREDTTGSAADADALERVQTILHSERASPNARAEDQPIRERMRQEARALMTIHQLLMDSSDRSGMPANMLPDLERGHERLQRFIAQLASVASGVTLEIMHRRLLAEFQRFKVFIGEWRRVIAINWNRPGTVASCDDDQPSTSTQNGTGVERRARKRRLVGGVEENARWKRGRSDTHSPTVDETEERPRAPTETSEDALAVRNLREDGRSEASSSSVPFRRLVGSPPRFQPITSVRTPSTLASLRNRLAQGTEQRVFGRPNLQEHRDDWEYSYDLNWAVNRAVTGTFMGNMDGAVASNILDSTCRIQRWTTAVAAGKYPDLRGSSNVIVWECKLHNDGSVSINQTGTLLACFVEKTQAERSVWAHVTLKVVSLRPNDLGSVLYQKTLGPNAISISFSPADGGRHILVGLASRRYLRLRHSPQTCAVVFALHNSAAGKLAVPGQLKLTTKVEHEQEDGVGLLTWGFRVDSVNCASWLPTPGQGLCYGTNRGRVYLLTPSGRKPEDAGGSLVGSPLDDTQQTHPDYVIADESFIV